MRTSNANKTWLIPISKLLQYKDWTERTKLWLEVDQTSLIFLSRYVVRFCIACTLSIIVLVLLFIESTCIFRVMWANIVSATARSQTESLVHGKEFPRQEAIKDRVTLGHKWHHQRPELGSFSGEFAGRKPVRERSWSPTLALSRKPMKSSKWVQIRSLVKLPIDSCFCSWEFLSQFSLQILKCSDFESTYIIIIRE